MCGASHVAHGCGLSPRMFCWQSGNIPSDLRRTAPLCRFLSIVCQFQKVFERLHVGICCRLNSVSLSMGECIAAEAICEGWIM